MARLGKRGPKKRLSRDTAEFFKVFLPRLPGYHQLMISPDFVKDFKRTIRERVLLKDLCGKEWHVYVNETPDGIFLKNGWEKLADYHSLTMGEFLVFRYDGAYSFIVKIFGTNGCKKKKKDLDNARVKIEDEMDQSLIPYDTQHSKRFEEVKESEEQNMSSKSSSFTSPGGIKSSSKLRILDEMIKEHNLKFEEEIILRNENGKEWPVNIITGRKDVKLFGKGWYDFQRDNNVGSNPCKFTFDNKSSPCRMANVQILRSGSDPSPKKTLKRGRGRPKKIETDICWVQVKSCDEKVAYSDELPEFFKIYVADESSETMRLPPDFIEEFGKDIPETCTLENPSGLSWKVEMKRVHDHCFFQNGWPEFVHENSLQDYDFLTFAYARNSTFYVKVYLRNGCLKVAEKNDDETTENLLENEASQQENPKSRSNTRRSTRTTTETLLVIEASQQEESAEVVQEQKVQWKENLSIEILLSNGK
ncbi:hypothetical protein ACS0TY_006675 [Phlomoides rotata]